MITDRVCSIDECDGKPVGRGWCSKHWQKWRRWGDPLGSAPPKMPCSVDDCDRPTVGRGWCERHWDKWRRYGDPTAGYTRPYKNGTALAFLMAHWDDDTAECIVWPFATNGHGYGVVRVNGQTRAVHVLACERHHGPRPDGMEAAHAPVICHNRACFNGRRHVAWATPVENNAHKKLDGTSLEGDAAPWAVLTRAQINEILARYGATPRPTQKELAAEYGVTPSNISAIIRGRSWGGTYIKKRKTIGLTDDQLNEIRSQYRAGGLSQDQLAAEYGVSQWRISHIVRAKGKYAC